MGGPDLAHLTAGDGDWYDWLRQTLLEAGDRLDFVTHHLYDSDGNRDVTDKLDGSTVFGNRPSLWDAVAPSVEEVLKSAGWFGRSRSGSPRPAGSRTASPRPGRRPTTAGSSTTGSPAGPERDWIDKIFFYELKDGPAETGLSWGLWRPDGSAKPAWDAYRRFVIDRP